jgi:hypothetical protein
MVCALFWFWDQQARPQTITGLSRNRVENVCASTRVCIDNAHAPSQNGPVVYGSAYITLADYQERRMDFITGALPNVMFIAGLIAIGLGLGIEFKIVEIKGELSKPGRFAAMGIGAVLVSSSIYLYTRPAQSIPAAVAGAQPMVVQANGSGTGLAPQAPGLFMNATALPSDTTTNAPATATVVPPTATSVPPTATVVPPTATSVPPTATQTATPTAVPGVTVPDIRGQNSKDAQKTLAATGLQLGERREDCEGIGAHETKDKLKRGQIRCQSPAPGSIVVPNTEVQVVLADEEGKHDD